MKYWEKVLYPPFLRTISGTEYLHKTDKQLDDELYNLAVRAIATFKFPRISLDYDCTYVDENDLIVGEEDNWVEEYWYFKNDVTAREIEVLLAWMKVFWVENQISDADNYLERYTDINIHIASPANRMDKNLKSLETFRSIAKEAETNYSRVTAYGTPALGEVNNDEI